TEGAAAVRDQDHVARPGIAECLLEAGAPLDLAPASGVEVLALRRPQTVALHGRPHDRALRVRAEAVRLRLALRGLAHVAHRAPVPEVLERQRLPRARPAPAHLSVPSARSPASTSRTHSTRMAASLGGHPVL